MIKYKTEDYVALEDLIEKVITNNMAVKNNHGYIFDVRSLNLGDKNLFQQGNNSFSIHVNLNEFDVSDILDRKDIDLLQKGDQIAFRIIETMDDHITGVITYSNVSGTLKMFNRSVKIVIDNSVIIRDNHKAYIKFGVGMINC